MTVNNPSAVHDHADRTAVRHRWTLLIAALGFLGFYLLTDFVAPMLASSPLPLPNDPTSQTRAWYADNGLAATVMAASQFMSVCFLGLFAVRLPGSSGRVRTWGLAAMALMVASSALACALAAVAGAASLDTVSVLRTASFFTGGAAHVLALGGFVFAASRVGGFGRALRVLAVSGLVMSVLSLSSLLFFQGTAFILLGRLLSMAWTVSAAISLHRRSAPASR